MSQNSGTASEDALILRRAPLAYSQLAHWRLYRLHERTAIRQVASVSRLCGTLHVDLLRKSLDCVVRRHEPLRTRIIDRNGELTQEVWRGGCPEILMLDLSSLTASDREAQLRGVVDSRVLAPTNVSLDPLVSFALVKISQHEHVLITAMEHMISDALSIDILLRDLMAVYAKLSKDSAPSLPRIGTQMAAYADAQRANEAALLREHGSYWKDRLSRCERTRFPAGSSRALPDVRGWMTVPIRIGAGMTRDLREWSRKHRTSLPLTMLSVYFACVLRWCEVEDTVIQYETHGRTTPDIANSLGYFAFPLYLRIQLARTDSLIGLVQRVRDEYIVAYSHADFSYLESQETRPTWASNTAFNWVPVSSGEIAAENAKLSLTAHGDFIEREHPMLETLDKDVEPALLLYEKADVISGYIQYPRNRFGVYEMERFVRNFMEWIHELLRDPRQRVVDVVQVPKA